MRMEIERVLGYQTSADGLRHCLASSADLFSRCVIGKETLQSWARRTDYDWVQTRGVYAMLRHIRRVPSLERRAVILTLDPGLEDADIAEMLLMEPAEVTAARERADEIRRKEPIPEWAEYGAAEMEPGDPDPAEIYRRAAELRRNRPGGRMPSHRSLPGDMRQDDERTPGLRNYLWSRRNCAFIPHSA